MKATRIDARFAASQLGLFCLPCPIKRMPGLYGLKGQFALQNSNGLKNSSTLIVVFPKVQSDLNAFLNSQENLSLCQVRQAGLYNHRDLKFWA